MSDTERFLMMQIVGTFKQMENNGLGHVEVEDLENVVMKFEDKLYSITVKEKK